MTPRELDVRHDEILRHSQPGHPNCEHRRNISEKRDGDLIALIADADLGAAVSVASAARLQAVKPDWAAYQSI
jgi:hypothetical protein